MRWISFTSLDGIHREVNLDHVVQIWSSDDGRTITLSDNTQMLVSEEEFARRILETIRLAQKPG